MRISDWSSDVCSSDLHTLGLVLIPRHFAAIGERIIVVIHFPEHCLGNRLLVFGPLLRPPSRREAIDRAEIMFPIGVIVSVEPGKSHDRSEEHTSELQSLMRISYAVFCLKKTTNKRQLK